MDSHCLACGSKMLVLHGPEATAGTTAAERDILKAKNVRLRYETTKALNATKEINDALLSAAQAALWQIEQGAGSKPRKLRPSLKRVCVELRAAINGATK